jgi:hypothetical protein
MENGGAGGPASSSSIFCSIFSIIAVDVSQESEYLPFYVTLSSSDIVIVIYGSFHLIPEVLEVIL